MVQQAETERRYSIFDEKILRSELDALDINPVHLENTWRYVLTNKGAEAYDAPDIPLKARSLFSSKFKTLTSQIQSRYDSSNGHTTKLIVVFQNGLAAEAVIIRHDSSGGKYSGARTTLCVSSQVGCKMGCTFCATGTMGFKGNLSSAEILEQLVHAYHITPIRNVVFMGMGEPLNNYEAVVSAVKSMIGRGFRLSAKRVTVSTVGVIPRILSLKTDLPEVNLALSLHAPTQELRTQIVPAARAFKISKLIAALDSYLDGSDSKVFVEYVMLSGVNDQDEQAHQLGQLLQGRNVVINLIPYNPTSVSMELKASKPEDVLHFQKTLKELYGLRTIVRQEMGQDIDGACGQLSLKHPQNQTTANLTDIEDIMC